MLEEQRALRVIVFRFLHQQLHQGTVYTGGNSPNAGVTPIKPTIASTSPPEVMPQSFNPADGRLPLINDLLLLMVDNPINRCSGVVMQGALRATRVLHVQCLQQTSVSEAPSQQGNAAPAT
jgi:hypothetical protein